MIPAPKAGNFILFIKDYDKLVLARKTQNMPCLFVEKITIQISWRHQRDFLVEGCTCCSQSFSSARFSSSSAMVFCLAK